jgi:hypothetical protein
VKFEFKNLIGKDHLGEMRLNGWKAAASYKKWRCCVLIVSFSQSTAIHGVSSI